MQVEQRLRDAELAFLNAPFHKDGWLRATRSLTTVTATAKIQLIGIGGPLCEPFNVVSEMPHDPYGHFGNMALHGEVNWRVGTAARAGTIQHEADYAAYRALHRTDDYDDACSDLDGLFGCQMALLTDATCLVGLALMRSRREGPCDAFAIENFTRVARQAQRSVRVQLALGQETAELMLEGTASRREATLLLDGFTQIAALTEAAEALFDHPHGLRLDGLAPRLANRAEQQALEQAFTRLLASDMISGPVLHQTIVGRCADRPKGRWRLHVARLPTLPHALTFEPQLALTFQPL